MALWVSSFGGGCEWPVAVWGVAGVFKAYGRCFSSNCRRLLEICDVSTTSYPILPYSLLSLSFNPIPYNSLQIRTSERHMDTWWTSKQVTLRLANFRGTAGWMFSWCSKIVSYQTVRRPEYLTLYSQQPVQSIWLHNTWRSVYCCLRLSCAHKVLYSTVLTVAVGFLHCYSCWGKDAAVLWPNCDFQLRGSWEVIRNWELIKYTLEIALKLPSN